MIVYPAEWTGHKEQLFSALARADGGGRRLWAVPVRARGFPESTGRARGALEVAKRQPRSRLGRALKFALLRGQYNWARHHFARHPGDVAVAWNAMTGTRRVFLDGARDAGAAALHAELAPFPGRVTLDPAGVNAAAGLPRDPAFYHDWAARAPGRGGGAGPAVRVGLRAPAPRRRATSSAPARPAEGRFLFCPLQVPNDSQITLFGGWTRSVAGMIEALADSADALPEGWHLRLKEHPSARQSMAAAIARAAARAPERVVIDNSSDSFALLAASGGVVTINSSMGLQAFFHDRPVIALGQAFWALPGLAEPAGGPAALRRLLASPEALSFDAALRAAFMNYLDQVYYPVADPLPDAAALSARLAQARGAAPATPPPRR